MRLKHTGDPEGPRTSLPKGALSEDFMGNIPNPMFHPLFPVTIAISRGKTTPLDTSM